MTAAILTRLLAAFFIIGGGANILAPGPIRAEFFRWGFPGWFHFLVGALELAAAAMLIIPGWRTGGLILAAATMVSAIAVVLYHREYGHALIPVVALTITGVTAWVSRSTMQ
ncbi:DoxX family protein [Agrobacterium tumefaciens]|uniref:DoxX family protein n=1 Tax=Agrobacterium tumefaciens TaxID=358 RepID=UPI00220EDA0D|nr:DoxX family protein [Agrobacterium tumefaciens]UXT00392.1 DoxX family protein [Agrobacterium tumefaciens]